MIDPDLSSIERELEASILHDSFADFVYASWPTIEPTRPLLPSVAIGALTCALQAVADGRIKRLAIACPPGVSKSLVAAVACPAWLLLRTNGRARLMCGSYSWDLARRDSRRCRDLVLSPWFRALVGNAWALRDDVGNMESDWSTTAAGRRMIASVSGKALGERATFQVIDDALSGADVHSASAKREAARWIAEVLPSRLEDPENDPRVLIGQRLCVDDPIGTALERGWSYLCLPATLTDESQRCELRDDAGELVWRDERELGQPLVSLLGPEALERLKAELGSTAAAAQYWQRPADDGAAILKRAWWRFHRPAHVPIGAPRPAGCDVDTPAVDTPASFDRVVIAADLTFGSTKGDFAVAQAWAAKGAGRYLLESWRARAGFEQQVGALAAMAKRWPRAKVVIERAANGAAVIETLSNAIPNVVPKTPLGSKAQRLSAIAPTVESGSCHLPLGWPGLDDFVEELAGATKHDDQADTAAYAIHELDGQGDPVAEFKRLSDMGVSKDGPLAARGLLGWPPRGWGL